MNELIKELAQCNERIQNFFETGPVQRAAIEQFAELIVEECIDRIKRVGILEDIENETDMVVDAVKEHFGVKS